MVGHSMKNAAISVLVCLLLFDADAFRSQRKTFANNTALANFSSVAPSQLRKAVFGPTPEDLYEKLERPIGYGSYGTVYKAREKGSETYNLAIKEVERRVYKGVEDQVMGLKLPFVADVFNVLKSLSKVSLVTRVYEGGTVHKYLEKTSDDKNYALLKSWGEQMAYGLWSLHRNKILYRDMKVENTFVRDESLQQVVLSDFGLSKICSANACGSKRKGTDSYMSPAMATGRRYGYEIDWWAHAVSLYRMARGGEFPRFKTVEVFGRHMVLSSEIANAEGKSILAPIETSHPELFKYLLRILDKTAYENLENDGVRSAMVGKASDHPFLSDEFWHGLRRADFRDPQEYAAKIDAFWFERCMSLAINKEKCVSTSEE
eukprot:TRINITY_DN21039_c0_g3_i1.p1 TRINITY_DN21039_c0_g3~~TRINITY_DN21039_c0_g3_i1.p1  ORF type:complete len:375 (-),score=55.39 TRINITY_DN21039_c0_g3_i1:186-1310(-)